MATPTELAERFWQLDFHDDTLVDIRIHPPQPRGKDGRRVGRGEASVVEVQFFRYWENLRRTIRFIGCANLRVAMDFDVLARNLPPNTSCVRAHTNREEIEALVRSQEGEWDVTYEPVSASPLQEKL